MVYIHLYAYTCRCTGRPLRSLAVLAKVGLLRFDSAPRTCAIREEATEWLKGAIDAPNPYALMATGARNSAATAIKAGVVSEEDFAELSAGDWIDIVWAHVHAGVREVITEAYWEKVGPMGVDPHKNPV